MPALAFAGAAAAGPLDALYDDADLTDLAQSYERGWRDNYENVFVPAFTPEEQGRLGTVRFRMERRVEGSEPFGFMAGGGTVIASAASLRFLEDIAMAYTWLDRKGYSTQTVADYLLMLRYWKAADGRPPKPWEALCIPADAFDDEEVAGLARSAFNTAAVFVLLHEYGHVLHRHPGNMAVSADVSRANEAAADRFAFDQFVRVGDMPVGVPILFFIMTHLHENRADYGSEEEYRQSLAARTHPVSPDRLQSLARHMSEWAASYDSNARPGSQVSALAIALEISQLAHLLADPDLQRLAARIGRTVRPHDLAPRPPGRNLAAPCGADGATGEAFDGALQGEITDGTTPLNIDVLLERNGNAVVGSYSFGAGFGRLEGTIEGATLSYRWRLRPDSGSGRLTAADGAYRGTWGTGASYDGSGAVFLRPAM